MENDEQCHNLGSTECYGSTEKGGLIQSKGSRKASWIVMVQQRQKLIRWTGIGWKKGEYWRQREAHIPRSLLDPGLKKCVWYGCSHTQEAHSMLKGAQEGTIHLPRGHVDIWPASKRRSRTSTGTEKLWIVQGQGDCKRKDIEEEPAAINSWHRSWPFWKIKNNVCQILNLKINSNRWGSE